MLRVLSRQYDYIILDSPPSLAVTDAIIMSAQVDSVLMVVDANSTRGEQFKLAVEKLREVNANIIGVVLNQLNPTSSGYGYYDNDYKDSYYDFDDGEIDAHSPYGASNGRSDRRKRQRALAANGKQ